MMNGMWKRRAGWAAVLLVICSLAVCACWMTGMGRSVRVFDDLLTGGLDFGDAPSKTFSLEQGTQYGALNSGPDYALPAGRYTLTWTTECDSPNRILLSSSNGARIEPDELEIRPDRWTDGAEITLLDDAENLQIRFCFDAGNGLKLHDAKLSFACTDGLWLATLLLIGLWMLYLLDARGVLTKERKQVLLILGVAVLVASVPALRENLNAGHDSEFHRMRLRNLVSALSEGQFPARVGGYMYNGYGGAASIFYPDVCLYLPALMMLGGATIQFAFSFLFFGINAVTAALTYKCGKRIFGNETAGVCASVLYMLAPYRLTDIYVRMAIGEAAAMAVIPLFVLGLWEVVFGDKDRWPLLAAGATAVFMTHMISTVLCALMSVAVGVVFAGRILREKRVMALLKAIALTVLINVYDLVPMVGYLLGGIHMGQLSSSVSAAAMEPMYLLASDALFPRDIGTALLLAVVVALCMLAGKADKHAATARIMIGVGVALAWMTTNLFPWLFVERRIGWAVNFLQFPWRLLMFVDLFFALAGGYGLAYLEKDGCFRGKASLIALSVCVLAVSAQISQYTVEDNEPMRYWRSNSHMISAYSEYTLPGTDVERTVTEHEVLLTGDADLLAYEKKGTRIKVQARADQGGTIVLPLFGFDGYAVQLNGERMEWTRGDNNRLTVLIPAGTAGELLVRFEGKPLWRIADAVSLMTVILSGIYLLRRRKNASAA